MNNLFIKYCSQFRRQRAPFQSKNFAKFIMLCGKGIKENIVDNRKLTSNILENKRDDVFVIYTEDVFSVIEKHKDLEDMDLLRFEELLVEISDGVILYLESFGSATELGAFAYLDSLAKKTLVFVDKKHTNSGSFIDAGPLKRISQLTKSSTNLGGVVFTKFLSNENIDFGGSNFSRIINFAKEKTVSLNSENLIESEENKSINIRPSLLVYFIIDLVFVFDFVDRKHIYNLLSKILVGQKYSFDFIIESRNKFNSLLVQIYIIDLLIEWGILKTVKSLKNDSELLSINYELFDNKSSISSTLGKVLFLNKMYTENEYINFKLKNRQMNLNLYGNVYE